MASKALKANSAGAASVGVKVVLFERGKTQALTSRGVTSALQRRAALMCASANAMAGVRRAEYAVRVGTHPKKRAHAFVHTANFAAMVDQHKFHTLNRALGRG